MVGLPAVGAPEVALLVALLAPVVVVVLVLAVGVRALDAGRARDDAIEELRRAYARGEIDDEEFERRRTRLEADR
jgi:putative membrane protein